MDKGPDITAFGGAQGIANNAATTASTSKNALEQKQQKIPKFKPGLHTVQGRQVVKGYSVTEDQLETLTTLGFGASAFFSIATGLLGFALNLMVTLDLTSDAPRAAITFWSGVETSCFIGFVFFISGGIAFALRRWWKTSAIKQKTKFEGE